MVFVFVSLVGFSFFISKVVVVVCIQFRNGFYCRKIQKSFFVCCIFGIDDENDERCVCGVNEVERHRNMNERINEMHADVESEMEMEWRKRDREIMLRTCSYQVVIVVVVASPQCWLSLWYWAGATTMAVAASVAVCIDDGLIELCVSECKFRDAESQRESWISFGFNFTFIPFTFNSITAIVIVCMCV